MSVLLSWTDKVGNAQEFVIDDGEYTLGRINKTGSSKIIEVNVGSVSSKHLRIRVEDETVFIKDLKSTHGTIVRSSKLDGGETALNKVDTEVSLPISLFTIEVGGHSVCVSPNDGTQALPVEKAPKRKAAATKATKSPKTSKKATVEEKETKAKKTTKAKKAKKASKKEDPEEPDAGEPETDDEEDIPMSLAPDDEDDDVPAPTQSLSILLTGVAGAEYDRLEALAMRCGVVAIDIDDADVVVAPRILKTPKVLCGICGGVPVVKTSWLEDSAKAGAAQEFTAHTLTSTDDREPDLLPEGYDTVSAAASVPEGGYLDGWSVFFHTDVTNADVLAEIVTAGGGTVVLDLPEPGPAVVIVALADDDDLATRREEGYIVCRKEALTYGALTQDFAPDQWTVDA